MMNNSLEKISLKKSMPPALKALLPFLAILSIGTILRFYKLGFKSLWADEGITWALTKFDAPAYGHPHLYFDILSIFL